jgi:hypothetical protein
MKLAAITMAVLLLAAAPAAAASGADAKAAIDRAKTDITTLSENGISVFAVNDMLREAELQFSFGDYDRAAEVAAQISALKDSALHADELLEQAEPRIAELERAGADTAELRAVFSRATDSFMREDFKGAEAHALDAVNMIEEAESKLNLQKTLAAAEGVNVRAFLSAYWKETLIAVAVLIVAARYEGKSYIKRAAKRKLARLKMKRANITNLMRETQRKHFIEGTIGRREYMVIMSNYRGQLADVSRQMRLCRPKGREKHAQTG